MISDYLKIDKRKSKIYNDIIIAVIINKQGEQEMKKLARKLSVFALSSIILLFNSHIEAGMFAEGQTYDLGTAGKITLENYNKISDDSEYFEFIKDNNKVCVEVGTDGYEVTVYSSDGRQLFHTYEKKNILLKTLY